MLIYNWLDKTWPARGGDVLQLLRAMREWEADIAQNGDEVRVEGFQRGLIGVVGTLGAGDGFEIRD